MALRLCFLILVARQLRAATDRCADDADCDSEEAQLLQVRKGVSQGKHAAVDENTLSAFVNAVNRQTPVFAGPRAEARSALCFSGGGSRSLSASVGQMRALEAAGVLPLKVDAISSVSGGTWAASQYMYVNGSSEEIIGNLSVPSQLTMEVLGKPPPKMGATANNSVNDILAKELSKKFARCKIQDKSDDTCLAEFGPDLWIDVISQAILGPYDLDEDMYMAASQEAIAEIVARNPSLDSKDVKWVVPRNDRPKTFVMNGVILAPVGYSSGGGSIVSLQMSPDYTGSPFFPNGSTSVSYTRAEAFFATEEVTAELERLPEETTGTVGGGFVESFAFGGMQPNATGQNGGPVTVGRPVKPFSLADAVGVSSAAPAKFLSAGVGMAQLNPIFAYWPIDPGVQAEPFQMGDGGNHENFGLLAMLQSGVNKSAVFVNTNKALNPNASATGSLCDWQEKEGELWGLLPPDGLAEAADMSVTCLFGECHDAIGAHYSNNQVFPNDKLQPLLCDLERLVQAGRPAVVKQTLDVLKNDWWGIVGGNQVEIVWFYNEKCTDFEAQLPEDTKAALAQGEDGPFANFPFYKTMLQNPPELTSLTVEQINLLSAQTQYAVQQSADLMCSVMGC